MTPRPESPDRHSGKEEIEVESDENQQGEEIEVDEDRLPSRAMATHEEIRQEGQKELERDGMALLWSAVAAGLSMGASLVAKGIFHVHLTDVAGGYLLETLATPSVLSSLSWPASSCLPRIP
ncbi:Inner membrane protein yfdC [Raoultella terrigena]|uniref:Inner membrane protein yfdC n=1 Tax=Raoultella terrigena TaxID=577 RepID=A0A4U9D0L5_RAOTE|nr:Inner membrane protein yfdC [Raoultella terrigena]